MKEDIKNNSEIEITDDYDFYVSYVGRNKREIEIEIVSIKKGFHEVTID